MVQIKSFFLAALFEIVCKTEDPYLNVGKCRQDIINRRFKEFNIGFAANTGDFDYICECGHPELKRGYINIYGDEVLGYKLIRKLVNMNSRTKSTFYLNIIEDGLLNETFVGKDENGQTVVNNFQLIVLKYDSMEGVIYFVRCSEQGKSVNDTRVIALRSYPFFKVCYGRRIANRWLFQDRFRRLRGEMRQI